MTSKEAFKDIYDRNEALKKEKHFHIGEKVMNIMKELVERDTPMKVIKEVDKKHVDTYDFYERDIYRCGSCKKVLIIDRHQKLQDNEKTNYCFYCGQKLKWE